MTCTTYTRSDVSLLKLETKHKMKAQRETHSWLRLVDNDVALGTIKLDHVLSLGAVELRHLLGQGTGLTKQDLEHEKSKPGGQNHEAR